VVWEFLNKYVQVFCALSVLSLCSDQSEFAAVYLIFNLWIAPGFIFGSCI